MSLLLYPASDLDAALIIQRAYDEAQQRFRVDAQVSVVVGVVDVDIQDTKDSIKIGDGSGNFLSINPDGSINFTPVSYTTQNTKNFYNSIAAVPANTLSTIVSYTVPSGKKAILQIANASGENISKYHILLNGNILQTKRSYFGGDLNIEFKFQQGFNLKSNDIVEIETIHTRPSTSNFEANIQIIEV